MTGQSSVHNRPFLTPTRATLEGPRLWTDRCLVALAPSYECDISFKNYKQQLLRARKNKDAVFRSQGTTLSASVSKLSDRLFEDLLGDMSAEIDSMFTQLAEKVVDTV